MLTYSLQCLLVLLTAGFAVAALRASRSGGGGVPEYGWAWRLTGVAFLHHSGIRAVQCVWGGAAMTMRDTPAVMESYLAWAPALNHAGHLLLLCYSGTLVLHSLRRTPWQERELRAYHWALVASALLGGALGRLEGSLLAARHYPVAAAGDVVELVLLLGALLVALGTDRVDRYLWGAVAVYASAVALSTLWFAVLSQLDNPGAWTPAPWMLAAYRATARAAMLALVLRRLEMGRTGRELGMISARAPSRAGLAG